MQTPIIFQKDGSSYAKATTTLISYERCRVVDILKHTHLLNRTNSF